MRRICEVALRHYLKAREHRHHIPAAFGYRDAHLVDWQALSEWLQRIVSLAQRPGEEWGEALERVCERVFAVWLARNGNGDSTWLRDAKHPLARVVRDLDWIAGELRLTRAASNRSADHDAGAWECCREPRSGPHGRSCRHRVGALQPTLDAVAIAGSRADEDAVEAAAAAAEFRQRLGLEVAA